MLTARPGESTLLGSWSALTRLSRAAILAVLPSGWAAVFPHWAVLNNALVANPSTPVTVAAAAGEFRRLYSAAGVDTWALWLPSTATNFDDPDMTGTVTGMTRDTTTLVMTLDALDDFPSYPRVVRTSIDAAARVGDEPILAAELPAPNGVDGLDGWALIHDGVAVAGAWTYRCGADVGVYAVGTAPEWRRRGLARALMLHVLADARQGGARTASLQSTPMGQRLYEQLGFRTVGRYEEWVARHVA